MVRLTDLAAELRQLADSLADLGADEQTIADTVEGASMDFEAKAQAIVAVIKDLGAEAEPYKEHAKTLMQAYDARIKRIEHLEDYLKSAMLHAGIKSVKGYASIKVIANQPAVDAYDIDKIPDEYIRPPGPTVRSPDKPAIKAAFESGKDVTGARLTISHRLKITY